MKQVVATALVLLLALFTGPILFLRGEAPGPEEPLPSPTATLPIDRTVVTPGQTADGRVQVRVALGDGEVLTLPLDKYLWRVVAAEMPASFEEEALKAQTCAARTYTAVLQKSAGSKHPDADICGDSTCCQAYIERSDAQARWGLNAQSYSEKIARAVADTDGLGVTYGGEPIQALFFSRYFLHNLRPLYQKKLYYSLFCCFISAESIWRCLFWAPFHCVYWVRLSAFG